MACFVVPELFQHGIRVESLNFGQVFGLQWSDKSLAYPTGQGLAGNAEHLGQLCPVDQLFVPEGFYSILLCGNIILQVGYGFVDVPDGCLVAIQYRQL